MFIWKSLFIWAESREMKWYSRAREDYTERLVFKYNQYIMNELVLITTEDCVKCKFVKWPLEEWCKKNWYKFKEMMYWQWMDEVTSVPCAMVGEDVILDYDGIIELITDKKKFY